MEDSHRFWTNYPSICIVLQMKVVSPFLIINLFSQIVFLDIVQVEQPIYLCQLLLFSMAFY